MDVNGVLRISSTTRNSVGFGQRQDSATVIWRGQVPRKAKATRKWLSSTKEKFENAALFLRFRPTTHTNPFFET